MASKKTTKLVAPVALPFVPPRTQKEIAAHVEKVRKVLPTKDEEAATLVQLCAATGLDRHVVFDALERIGVWKHGRCRGTRYTLRK